MTLLGNLWNDDRGQDIIEYTLLMAFVVLASAALVLGVNSGIVGFWTTTNNNLSAANGAAS
jgi:Flp pilus assembly pilin Flp